MRVPLTCCAMRTAFRRPTRRRKVGMGGPKTTQVWTGRIYAGECETFGLRKLKKRPQGGVRTGGLFRPPTNVKKFLESNWPEVGKVVRP